MKLFCSLLKQRLSSPRNLIKDRAVGFAAGEVLRGDARNYYPEKKPVGDLIVFKPARDGARVGTAPIDHGTVVVFTGVWQERHKEKRCETKRARRVSGRRPEKSGGKPGGGPQK